MASLHITNIPLHLMTSLRWPPVDKDLYGTIYLHLDQFTDYTVYGFILFYKHLLSEIKQYLG